MKRFLAILLLPVFISSWVSLNMWHQDPSGNGRTDLEDAILFVKDFAETAQNPAAFKAKVRDAVTTLRVVAGLKTVIKPVRDAQSANNSENLNLPYLIASNCSSIPSEIWWVSPETFFSFQTMEKEPFVPPPQHTPVC